MRPLSTLCALTVATTLASVCAADGEPGIVARAGVFDFGTVEQGSTVSHAFRLENTGSTPLRIENVKGTCGCTIAASSEHDLAPGGSAEVTVQLDTARIAGPTRKTVTVYTNDPSNAVLGLTLAGTVDADLVLAPTALYVGRVRRGQPTGRDITISAGRKGGRARVTWVEPSAPGLQATLADVPGGGQRLHVELAASMPLGPFAEHLMLHTTSEQHPEVRFGVFGTIEGDVAVVPAQLTFGTTHGAVERGVHVRNEGPAPVAVTSASVPPELGTCALETIEPGREYRVTVRLRDGLAPGTVDGSLDIFTDHPDEGHLVVPLHGVVRPGRG